MDTSKEYIKMCEKAEELNYSPSGTDGNWYYYKYEDTVKCKNSYEGEFGDVWLPRQDQLQGMIEYSEELHKPSRLCMDIERFAKKCYCDVDRYLFSSMEQLWLAFVMKEKYNKVWTGEGWLNHP